MKIQSFWPALLLLASLGIQGCNSGELEPGEGSGNGTTDPTVPPVEPNPNPDPDPEPDPEPVENVGTWENKDEDGDGVPDEQDDYPFDGTKQGFASFSEQEPNDNPSNATKISLTPPFRISGAISQKSDNGDLFSFIGEEGKYYSLVLTYSDLTFQPNIYFSGADGYSLNFGKVQIDKALKRIAINVEIQNDGKYHIGVNDINFDGGESFTYNAEIFIDMDGDALADDLESAMEINNLTHDTDGDGIWDTEEFLFGAYSLPKFDADEDNIANWLDSDSDGDGLLDKTEGSRDVDNDSLGNFIDTDSDGNNIDDVDEAGDNLKNPLDSDFDLKPDYQDLDDDNDGVLDVNDENRLLAVEEHFDSFVSLPKVTHNGNKVAFVREGDTFSFDLEWPLANSNGFMVFKRGTQAPVNIPFLANNGEFSVAVPKHADEFFITDGNFRSNIRKLDIKNQGVAVISSDSAFLLNEMDVTTISGSDFSQDMTITANGKPVEVISFTSKEATIRVPSDLSDGYLQVNNAYGVGNAEAYYVVKNTEATIDLLGSVNAEQVIVETFLGTEYAVDASGSQVVRHFKNRLTPINSYIKATAENKRSLYLSAYILPGETLTQVNIENTTFKHLLDYIGTKKIPLADLLRFRDEVVNYPEFIEVQDHFIGLLAQSPTALDDYSTETTTLLLTNSRKIYSKYQSSTLTSNKKKHRMNEFGVTASSALASGTVKPNIVDFGTDHFDYSLSATNFTDNWLPSDPSCPENTDISDEQKNKLQYDGCVELENRTKLYLSTQIIPLGENGEYDEEKLNSPLRKHINSAYDGNILGSQSGTFLGLEFWSNDQYYVNCPYQSCLYQVLSPGVNTPLGPSPFSFRNNSSYDKVNLEARQALAIRTIIDGILLPFVDIILEGINYKPPKVGEGVDRVALTKAIIKYSPTLIQESAKIYNDDNVTAADMENFTAAIFMEFYKNEVESFYQVGNGGKFGPITKAVFKELAISPQDLAFLAAEAVARKWLPVAGQAEALITGAKIADILVDQVKTIKDMMFVPVKSDFTVTWGLKIVDIEPSIMLAEAVDKPLTIIGTGMGINERWYWFDEEPLVFLEDKQSGNVARNIKHDAISETGTRLDITIPASFLAKAVGPISVRVEHRDQEAMSPIDIQIGEGLEISRLKKDTGQPGDTIVIEGVGFSNIKAENSVTFAGKNNSRIKASISKVESNKLTLSVPDGIVTGDVTVEVNNQVSNGITFTLPYILDVTFGDNGNFNDDIFKLVVDNKVMTDGASPERKVGPISIPLSAGKHTVKLVGIRAEDEIGTYYIEFSGNVTSVSGDNLEGRDLLKDSVKTFNVEVGDASQRFFNNPAPLRSLQQE